VRIDQTAVIGHPPEHRDRHPADPGLAPVIDGDVRIEAYVTVDAGMLSADGHWPRRVADEARTCRA
jgi:hypothetical protein